MKRPALWHNQVEVLQMAFQAPFVFGTFEKWALSSNKNGKCPKKIQITLG